MNNFVKDLLDTFYKQQEEVKELKQRMEQLEMIVREIHAAYNCGGRHD